MDKKDENSAADPDLSGFRTQIDAIDEKIIALLSDRTVLVKQVGSLKHKVKPGQCPIRPGREAEMVRSIIEKTSKTEFSPAGAAAIWRIMIGTYTAMESPLALSVYTPEGDSSLAWVAREYFGPTAPITRQPQVKRVIGDVMDGKAAVGIVPFMRTSEDVNWWTSLIQQGGDMPKIFAHIPFVYYDTPGKDAPSALAIARIQPEQTSDDMSLVVLEADPNTSQHRLQTALAQAKLEANWINIVNLTPASRHHLLSIKGFITPEHQQFNDLLAGLGASILNVSYLGAYAVPMVLPSTSTSHKPESLRNASNS